MIPNLLEMVINQPISLVSFSEIESSVLTKELARDVDDKTFSTNHFLG